MVNLYSSPLSSNIKPLDDLGLQGTINTASNTAAHSEREVWQPLALAASGLTHAGMVGLLSFRAQPPQSRPQTAQNEVNQK